MAHRIAIAAVLSITCAGCANGLVAGAATAAAGTTAIVANGARQISDLRDSSGGAPFVLPDYYGSMTHTERPPNVGEPYCIAGIPRCVQHGNVSNRARVRCAWEGEPRCDRGPAVACGAESFAFCSTR
jgi:hypothetical protein